MQPVQYKLSPVRASPLHQAPAHCRPSSVIQTSTHLAHAATTPQTPPPATFGFLSNTASPMCCLTVHTSPILYSPSSPVLTFDVDQRPLRSNAAYAIHATAVRANPIPCSHSYRPGFPSPPFPACVPQRLFSSRLQSSPSVRSPLPPSPSIALVSNPSSPNAAGPVLSTRTPPNAFDASPIGPTAAPPVTRSLYTSPTSHPTSSTLPPLHCRLSQSTPTAS